MGNTLQHGFALYQKLRQRSKRGAQHERLDALNAQHAFDLFDLVDHRAQLLGVFDHHFERIDSTVGVGDLAIGLRYIDAIVGERL